MEFISAKVIKRTVWAVLIFVVGLILYFNFTQAINQGHAGVVYNRSHGVEDKTLGQGLQLVNPFERITEYPVSTETILYKGTSLATKDGKPLEVDITMEYFNDVEKLPYIYNKFKGQDPTTIENTWLKARLKDSALAVTSQYTILQVFQEREKISVEIEEAFKKSVAQHGFVVENIVFGTPKPDANTAKAIQAVVDAQQDLEKLKIDKLKATEVAEKQLIEAKGVADANIEKARGTAESTLVQARAQAKANKELDASLTDKIIEKMNADARLKHGYVTIQGATPLVEVK